MSSALSKLSSVHRGVAFEQRSLNLLQAHLSMALRRVGGRSDGGVDLVGWWWLPFATDYATHRPGALTDTQGLPRRRLRILAQCKAEKKKFSPKYVREMEGVWHLQSNQPLVSANASIPDGYPTVALLLSESPFSRSTVLHAYRSIVPFLLVHLPPPSATPTRTDEVGTVCPNPTLTHIVTPLAFRWERHPVATTLVGTDATRGGRPGLWWQDRKLDSWTPDYPNTGMA